MWTLRWSEIDCTDATELHRVVVSAGVQVSDAMKHSILIRDSNVSPDRPVRGGVELLVLICEIDVSPCRRFPRSSNTTMRIHQRCEFRGGP